MDSSEAESARKAACMSSLFDRYDRVRSGNSSTNGSSSNGSSSNDSNSNGKSNGSDKDRFAKLLCVTLNCVVMVTNYIFLSSYKIDLIQYGYQLVAERLLILFERE